jgi:hypothetical protein
MAARVRASPVGGAGVRSFRPDRAFRVTRSERVRGPGCLRWWGIKAARYAGTDRTHGGHGPHAATAQPRPCGGTGLPRGVYFNISRALLVHASVTSRMNFAWVVARLDIQSISVLPARRSIVDAIDFSAFS